LRLASNFQVIYGFENLNVPFDNVTEVCGPRLHTHAHTGLGRFGISSQGLCAVYYLI
jgi:hypothetical protein